MNKHTTNLSALSEDLNQCAHATIPPTNCLSGQCSLSHIICAAMRKKQQCGFRTGHIQTELYKLEMARAWEFRK